jgi:hypothetical protein
MEELWFAADKWGNTLRLVMEERNGEKTYTFQFHQLTRPQIITNVIADRKHLKDLFNAIGNEIDAFLDIPEIVKKARAEALLDAAQAWQTGQWADAPRRSNPVQERIANGKFVTDWLKDRAYKEELGLEKTHESNQLTIWEPKKEK